MKTYTQVLALVVSVAAFPVWGDDAVTNARPGYTDTDFIPGTTWRVHDATRPYPPVVVGSPFSLGARPPSDAIVLFDGKDLSRWRGKGGAPATWKVQDGYMEVTPKAGNISTVESFGDCQLHIEWATPVEFNGDSQKRSNSGVFLMGVYEVQILDSFENPTYADGQAGAIYGQYPPLANATFRPGEWQCYDLVFKAPRFNADGSVKSPAYLTLFHNGVLMHLNRAYLGASTHKKAPKYVAHSPKAPLGLQDHNNPMKFRNIWIRPLELGEETP